MLRLFLSLSAASLLWVGCGDECEFDTECSLGTFCIEGSCAPLDAGRDTSRQDTGTDTNPEDAGTDTMEDAPADSMVDAPLTCNQTGFMVATESAEVEAGEHRYQARGAMMPPSDALVVRTAPDTPLGVYDLSMENLAGCQRCVSIRRACGVDLQTCEVLFLPVSGSLELTSLGALGESFAGTVSGVFQEFDGSQFVADGEVWCLENQPLSALVMPPQI